MSAGRLQLYDKRAGPRDRTSRLLVAWCDGGDRGRGSCACASSAPSRPPGSSCCAPASSTATRRSPSSAPRRGPTRRRSAELLDAPRPLHALLRDQRTIAGIGRSWVDEILWQAQLSPYKRGADLDAAGVRAPARGASTRRSAARSPTTSRRSSCRSPTSCRCPCSVHRHEGEPCPRCGTTLRGGPLRGLRDRLLPRLPDRRARAQGPAALAAVEVGAPHPGRAGFDADPIAGAAHKGLNRVPGSSMPASIFLLETGAEAPTISRRSDTE